MDFITVRELRLHPTRVWRSLERAHELVLTLRGRPIGILAKTPEGGVEEVLKAFRQARTAQAITQLRTDAARSGADQMTPALIQKEINAVRHSQKH